jgi:hypothetical protein
MLLWVGQAIIVVQTCFHENIIFRESNAQYAFEQGRNSLLMGAIDVPPCTLFHILSLSFLFVGLLGPHGAWCKMMVTMIIVRPIVTKEVHLYYLLYAWVWQRSLERLL